MKLFTESRENRMEMDKHLECRPLCLMNTTSADLFLLMSVMADPFLLMRGEQ